jgi:alpha-glucosidase (family GH31 glycosyl hydrolase)
MFGFQMVGPDICGFGGNTNEELCARWYQIGSLYTFARSHNDLQSIDQEPYALGETVLKSAVKNLKLRYSLLKYFYYLFVTKKGLGSIWRPLFFEYPADGNTYLDDVVDTQFMIGPNFLAAPIVEQGQTSRKVYLPEGNWYYFHTGIKYASGTHLIENVGLTDMVPLFLKEGVVMYKQDTTNVVNTKQLTNHFDLLAGVKFDTRRSNSTHKVYEATGSMLSIKDYNNDALVDECSRQGCDYVIAFVVSISNTARTL